LKAFYFSKERIYFAESPTKNNNMDVISEIKQFELHPDRPHFSSLQVNDFYKKLVGQSFKFEAIISSVTKGTHSDYEMHADTYAYTILHNPVSDRDYLNWAPDLPFVCEAGADIFKFNPITDLIKGDRCHCTATFISREEREIRVKLSSFQKVSFLEVEREKDLLEKKFQNNYEELTVFAPQRQFQKNTFNTVLFYALIGGLIGVCFGLFWGCIESFVYSDASIISYGFEGALAGTVIAGAVGFLRSMIKPPARRR
jgi:hypothetical protein